MDKITFGIIGGGWRSEFFLRIAKALPERFAVGAMLVRNEDKGKAIEAEWGVTTFRNMDDFLRNRNFGFVVLSLPRQIVPEFIIELTAKNIPVLVETPPAEDAASLARLYEAVGAEAKVQVAEQYLFQPMHAARIALAKSGKLGEISHVQVSAAHGYHGISLIRQLLGITFENAEIRGERFITPLLQGPDRDGSPRTEEQADSVQDFATLRFGNKSAVFDFTGDQYFSWVRGHRLLVRGHKGEIVNEDVRYMQDYQTPIYGELRRVDTGHHGNLEGYYHKGVQVCGEWVYLNPYAPGRLADDEIAIAASLDKMGAYAEGGPSFYSLAEASQDHYLSLMLTQAVESGQTVTTSTQVWAE